MAPTKKRARPRDRAAAAASRPSDPTPASSTSLTPLAQPQNKKTKRQTKHDALLHKISASAPGKIKRRRRKATALPSMDTMLSALPDVEWEGFSSDEAAPSDGRMRMKTLKSKRGAGKARQKLERSETERMGKNMAAMATAGQGQAQTSAQRWEALRGFIGATMEKSEMFKKEEPKEETGMKL